jgi:hypothetical protein
MTKTVYINGKPRLYRGKDIGDIIAKVKADFPQIKDWQRVVHNSSMEVSIHGKCYDPVLFVDIPPKWAKHNKAMGKPSSPPTDECVIDQFDRGVNLINKYVSIGGLPTIVKAVKLMKEDTEANLRKQYAEYTAEDKLAYWAEIITMIVILGFTIPIVVQYDDDFKTKLIELMIAMHAKEDTV